MDKPSVSYKERCLHVPCPQIPSADICFLVCLQSSTSLGIQQFEVQNVAVGLLYEFLK